MLMRSLSIEQIEDILSECPFDDFKSNIFVETGTYEGGTVFNIYEYFQKIHTIELNKKVLDLTINKSKKQGIENIIFHNGQSQDILPDLITEELNNYNQCIFFLDAHYTYNPYGLTSKGDIDVPVLKEIEIICELFKNKCIIIIDDADAMGNNNLDETAQADWSEINKIGVVKASSKRNAELKYFTTDNARNPNNRLILFVDKKEDKIDNFYSNQEVLQDKNTILYA